MTGRIPTPEDTPMFAKDAVRAAREVSGIALDFSAESIKHVDQIIEGIRHEKAPQELIDHMLFLFGCYVGEVLVRQAGAVWKSTGTNDWPFVRMEVINEQGTASFNPIEKVAKRYDNGPEDDLWVYYMVLMQSFKNHDDIQPPKQSVVFSLKFKPKSPGSSD